MGEGLNQTHKFSLYITVINLCLSRTRCPLVERKKPRGRPGHEGSCTCAKSSEGSEPNTWLISSWPQAAPGVSGCCQKIEACFGSMWLENRGFKQMTGGPDVIKCNGLALVYDYAWN